MRKAPLLLALLFALLQACGSTTTVPEQSAPSFDPQDASIGELVRTANATDGLESAQLRILALEAMIARGDNEGATRQWTLLNNLEDYPETLQLRAALLEAQLALRNGQTAKAVSLLTETADTSFEDRPELLSEYLLVLGQAYQDDGQYELALASYLRLGETGTANAGVSLNVHNEIWDAITRFSPAQLDNFASTANSYQSRGWVELARVVNSEQYSIRSQLDAIRQWQRIWSQHPASQQLPQRLTKLELSWQQRPKHIALILPLQDSAGKAIQEGFLSAYYAALDISRDVPKISVFDSSNLSNVYPIYDAAVASGADLIIGPLYKQLVNQLQQLDELPVPTLALNYSDDSINLSNNLTQFGLAP